MDFIDERQERFQILVLNWRKNFNASRFEIALGYKLELESMGAYLDPETGTWKLDQSTEN